MDEFPRSARRVRDALVALGLPTEIRRLADSTRTTPEATAAVGCELGATRSRCCCEGRRVASLLALLSGANRAHAPVERCLEILGDGHLRPHDAPRRAA
jgi:hypothetical protein